MNKQQKKQEMVKKHTIELTNQEIQLLRVILMDFDYNAWSCPRKAKGRYKSAMTRVIGKINKLVPIGGKSLK